MNDTQPENQGAPDPGAATPPPTDPQGAGGDSRSHTKAFFDQVRSLGVTRSSDRWVGGVCGGVARRFDVDPLIIRAGMIALLLLGVGFVAYLIAWALLPDHDGSILAEKGIRDGDGWGITILVVIAIAVFGSGPWWGGGSGWGGPLVAVGALALIWYVLTQRKKDGSTGSCSTDSASRARSDAQQGAAPTAGGPTAPQYGTTQAQPAWSASAGGSSSVGYEPPPSSERADSERAGAGSAGEAHQTPKAKRAGLAGLLLVIGAAILGYGIGMAASGSTFVGLLGATGAAGLATILLGALGRRSFLSSLLSLGLAVSLLGSWGADHVPQGAFGEQTWRPVAASEQTTYSWSMGQATLDLRGITERPQQDEIEASISFGELIIYVPENVTTRVVATAQFGNASIDGVDADPIGESRGGTSVREERVFGTGAPQLTVHANARFGQVKIISTADPS